MLKKSWLFGLATMICFFCFSPSALAANTTVSGAFLLMNALLYNGIPWATGVIVDFLVLRGSVKAVKALLTGILGIVLAFGGIWFVVAPMFLTSGNAETAWIMAGGLLWVTFTVTKLIAYWVINEAAPSKKAALLLVASALVMVGSAFVAMQMPSQAPAAPAPAAQTAAPAPTTPPAPTTAPAQTTTPEPDPAQAPSPQ